MEPLTKHELLEELVNLIVRALMPNAKVHSKVDDDRKRIQVKLIFEDAEAKEYIGLLFGHAMSNTQALMQILRSQQIVPHDRYIELVVQLPNETQTFLNKDVSKYRKQSYDAAIAQGASHDEAAETTRKQSEKRRLIRVVPKQTQPEVEA